MSEIALADHPRQIGWIPVVKYQVQIQVGNRPAGKIGWLPVVETRLESRLEITPGNSGGFLGRMTRRKIGLEITLGKFGWLPVPETHVEIHVEFSVGTNDPNFEIRILG